MKSRKKSGRMTRRALLGGVLAGSAILAATGWGLFRQTAEAGPQISVWKSPRCGCCGKWVDHLRDNGFEVKVFNTGDVTRIKRRYGVPLELGSCHTATVGDYVIEGHVPADSIRRLLAERPPARGLAVPRMPIGSPGMEGPDPEAYEVLLFDDRGGRSVFERKMGRAR